MACFTIELVCVRGEWFITEPRALNEIQPSHTARYGTKCIRNPVGHETESPRGVMGVAPGARQCARENARTLWQCQWLWGPSVHLVVEQAAVVGEEGEEQVVR